VGENHWCQIGGKHGGSRRDNRIHIRTCSHNPWPRPSVTSGSVPAQPTAVDSYHGTSGIAKARPRALPPCADENAIDPAGRCGLDAVSKSAAIGKEPAKCISFFGTPPVFSAPLLCAIYWRVTVTHYRAPVSPICCSQTLLISSIESSKDTLTCFCLIRGYSIGLIRGEPVKAESKLDDESGVVQVIVSVVVIMSVKTA